MSEIAELLAAQRFLRGMQPKHLEVLAGASTLVTSPGGTLVFEQGSAADACYVLLQGSVALEVTVPGKPAMILMTLHSGDVLGWSWLFPPAEWAFDARAQSDVSAIRLDAEQLLDAKDADAELGYDLIQRFSKLIVQRLQATRIQMLDLYASYD